MKYEIKTECELHVGQNYSCVVINFSVGLRAKVCFVKYLRFDGNDENNHPIFSEEYFTVTKDSYFGLASGKFRRYNDDNFIVVGVLPERAVSDADETSVNYWKNQLKVKSIEQDND